MKLVEVMSLHVMMVNVFNNDGFVMEMVIVQMDLMKKIVL